MTDNYFDGAWRPAVGDPDKAIDVLKRRGFEIGADEGGRLMARWPIAPAAPLTSCRACRVEFEDTSGHKLCDSCLVDRVNGAGELELDDPDDVINQPSLTLPMGVTIRHSHGRYYATNGRRYGRWAETEAGALEQWISVYAEYGKEDNHGVQV